LNASDRFVQQLHGTSVYSDNFVTMDGMFPNDLISQSWRSGLSCQHGACQCSGDDERDRAPTIAHRRNPRTAISASR
jgi:hypothetical protein